jgi:hypothetical protein
MQSLPLDPNHAMERDAYRLELLQMPRIEESMWLYLKDISVTYMISSPTLGG